MKNELTEPIRVMIADDHVLYRAGVITSLSAKPDITVVGEADNGVHLLNLVKSIPTDIILLDIEMPMMNGIDTLIQLKEHHKDIKVIMLTFMEDQSMVSKLMELGANTYLSKTSDSEIIYEAIKTCFDQEYYFNQLTNQAMLSSLKQKAYQTVPDGPAHHAGVAHHQDVDLNEKEITVLRLMCEEKSTKEIADIVNISPRTVEAIRDKLRLKTGAKSTAGLIMFAVRNKIIEE
jgi:DNA-binding NarL/FixJ family response regulator